MFPYCDKLREIKFIMVYLEAGLILREENTLSTKISKKPKFQ